MIPGIWLKLEVCQVFDADKLVAYGGVDIAPYPEGHIFWIVILRHPIFRGLVKLHSLVHKISIKLRSFICYSHLEGKEFRWGLLHSIIYLALDVVNPYIFIQKRLEIEGVVLLIRSQDFLPNRCDKTGQLSEFPTLLLPATHQNLTIFLIKHTFNFFSFDLVHFKSEIRNHRGR